jgi:hypothetical protein
VLKIQAPRASRAVARAVAGRYAVCCRWLVGSAIAFAAFGLAASPAGAKATTESVTFNCLGITQYFQVPPGVTVLTFSADGAAGGAVSNAGNPGNGATTTGTLPVTAKDLLAVDVGCRSGYGYARGGPGGFNSSSGSNAGGGGGATGVADLNDSEVLLVAAGGGGAGGNGFFDGQNGGNGGGGTSDGTGGTGLGSGGGGSAGGSLSGTAGDTGGAGSSAAGGGGGGGGGYPTGGAGGGGGGLGGGGGGGGGGGDSYAIPAASGVSTGVDSTAEDGSLTLTFTRINRPADPVVGLPQTYQCTGAAASYAVPVRVSKALVTEIGAAGASGNDGGAGSGGDGATESALVPVTHHMMQVGVGCSGQPGTEGPYTGTYAPGGAGGYGYSSGGAGGSSNYPALLPGDVGGCGGGGSTGLASTTGTRLVAGGGGGCGGSGGYGNGGTGGSGGSIAGGTGSGGTGVGAGGGGAFGASLSGATGDGGGTSDQGLLAGGGGGGGGGYTVGGGGGSAGGAGGGGGGGGGAGLSFVGTGVVGEQSFSLASYQSPNGLLAITPLYGNKLPHPAPTGVVPSAGPVAGGTPIVVTGTDFGVPGSPVEVETVTAGTVTGVVQGTVVSPTQVDATTPAVSAASSGEIRVVTPFGTSTLNHSVTFTYS